MNQEIMQKLYREFSYKRERALNDAARRKEQLYAVCPALNELDGAAADLSREHFKARLAGEADSAEYEQKMADISARRAELMKGADIQPHFECPVCQDTGRVKAGYCKCFQNRIIEENLAGANLSVSSAHERFENFDLKYYSDILPAGKKFSPRERMRENLNICKEFVTNFDQPGKSLLMAGGSGLGKTFLSSAIAHELLEKGYTVMYLSASEFCARIQANRFGENAKEMDSYYEADLLILDDLGTEFRTQLTSSVLGEVIDRRQRRGKKMVFSTNLGAAELEKNYSSRIISRFLGGFIFMQFVGDDIRIQKRSK